MKDSYRVVGHRGAAVGGAPRWLYHLAKLGWNRCLPAGTLGPPRRAPAGTAAGGIHALNADPKHRRVAGLHDRSAARDREGVGPGHRPAHDRRPDHGGHARSLGVAPVRLPRVPVHRDRGLLALVTGRGGGGPSPDHCRPTGLLGGMWADREGYYSTPPARSMAYAKAAKIVAAPPVSSTPRSRN